MKIKQLSVFLENRAGRLANVTRELGAAQVNILALSLADTSDFGILRLIVDDVEKARDVLTRNSHVCRLSEVVALEVANRPGGLADILDIVEPAGVNVEYMYAFAEPQKNAACLVFRFSDLETAAKVLEESGIDVNVQLDLGA